LASRLAQAKPSRDTASRDKGIVLEDRSIDLQEQEGFVVPKGVVHRARAPDRAVILMVETAAIVPTCDGR
jgi:hypothetical protein